MIFSRTPVSALVRGQKADKDIIKNKSADTDEDTDMKILFIVDTDVDTDIKFFKIRGHGH